ncbi:MAG TPA: hypothetical protein DCR14_16915, partial [Acidimicrobiaceae bacterium]|nr:hypothetical protein [Acidimicrobiaceae bacterium]
MPRILGLTGCMLAASVTLLWLLPGRDEALRPTEWWVALIIAGGFAVAERWAFHFEFRREAISFSLSEVPTVFALLYLSPLMAVVVRVAGSLVVIAVRRGSKLYKLAFNGALFAIEMAFATHLLRFVTERTDHPAAMVAALIPATAISTIAGSVLVSTAIALVEGGWLDRVRSELRLSWWMAPTNASIGAATAAPTLVSPWLAPVAIAPLAAGWSIVRAFGRLEQRHRDLDAQLGFVRTVGQNLGLRPVAMAAAAEAARLLRARGAAVLVFDTAGDAVA